MKARKFPDHVEETKEIKAVALNSGNPWTESEVQIATAFLLGFSRRYMSIEEIALKLGRSYGSVVSVQGKARWAKRFERVLKNEVQSRR